jgi:enamine deaminase RidA (YjgF/YER057c/UK114 family)
MPNIEAYAAKGVYDPPIYAQAVKVSGAQTILYIAGQVAYTAEGGVAHPGDFKAQARAALQALKAQVEAGGGTMANIVKVNTYLTDIRHRARLRADPRGVFRQEDAGAHVGRGSGAGAARIPDRDRSRRRAVGPRQRARK